MTRSPHEIVVVEASRDRARAAVFARESDSRATRTVEATGIDARAAALAALESLGTNGKTPVVIVTDDVTTACLEWPAPATGPLAPERLGELVRWEIEPFVPGEGDVACGWAEAEARTAGGRVRRLTCGARRPVIEGWKTAVRATGRSLVGLYPRGACALGAVAMPSADATSSGGASAVLELHDDSVGCVRVRGRDVEAVRLRACDPTALADACVELAGDAPRALLAGSADLVARIEPALRARGIEPAPAHEQTELASLAGAARHALGLAGGERLPSIATADPVVPLGRRPWVISLAAGVAAAVVLALVHVVLARRLEVRAQALDVVRKEVAVLDRAARAASGLDKPKLQAEVARLEKEVARATEKRARLDDLARANERALELLDALAACATDEVALERVRRDPATGDWLVAGFALTEAAAQQFGVLLARRVERSGLVAHDLATRSEIGRLGIAGHAFDLKVSAARGGERKN